MTTSANIGEPRGAKAVSFVCVENRKHPLRLALWRSHMAKGLDTGFSIRPERLKVM